ncbi:SAM-dependent methyltransferase [Methanopyrus sp. KOL6]|uniref:SAM-dependent methyltransferase n=1 Tax=Methanopyrus sp. KOL6 TaxID=1937004 RepID=UPI0012F7F957|nr:SAM-dependent methyltransferase [Methanopyrus sp. KOL6]
MRLIPIGLVVKSTDEEGIVRVRERYRKCLEGLEGFSHVWILWWGHEADRTVTKVRPVHGRVPELVGVFACRSPDRPNPVLLTLCRILEVRLSSGELRVSGLDARTGSPVVDMKPYLPDYDEPDGEVSVPEWVERVTQGRRPPRTRGYHR